MRLYMIEERYNGKWSYFSEPVDENRLLTPKAYLQLCKDKFPDAILRITYTTKP